MISVMDTVGFGKSKTGEITNMDDNKQMEQELATQTELVAKVLANRTDETAIDALNEFLDRTQPAHEQFGDFAASRTLSDEQAQIEYDAARAVEAAQQDGVIEAIDSELEDIKYPVPSHITPMGEVDPRWIEEMEAANDHEDIYAWDHGCRLPSVVGTMRHLHPEEVAKWFAGLDDAGRADFYETLLPHDSLRVELLVEQDDELPTAHPLTPAEVAQRQALWDAAKVKYETWRATATPAEIEADDAAKDADTLKLY